MIDIEVIVQHLHHSLGPGVELHLVYSHEETACFILARAKNMYYLPHVFNGYKLFEMPGALTDNRNCGCHDVWADSKLSNVKVGGTYSNICALKC